MERALINMAKNVCFEHVRKKAYTKLFLLTSM